MMKKHTHKLREQTTTGGAIVQNGAHTDSAYGIYDRPSKSKDPIVPSEMVATQLAIEKPPVEDEDYLPLSKDELARAVSEISKTVSPESIQKFYRQVKEYAEQCEENQEEPVQGQDKMKLKSEVAKRKAVKKMINEVFDELETVPGGASLGDIATEFGFKGPSGARNYVATVTTALKMFIQSVQPEELERLKNFAVGEYADLLEKGEYIDAEEADVLRANPRIAENFDSFRYFFSAAFVIPVVKRQAKTKEKEIYRQLGEMGAMPIAQTVMNQLMGYSKKDPEYVKQKLTDLVKSGQMSRSHADLVHSEVMANYARLEQYTKSNVENVADLSLSGYQKTSAAARANVLRQALEYTKQDAEGTAKFDEE